MSEATAVCVPCERPHEHLRPLAEVMKNMYVAHPEAAESVMEYFSALHCMTGISSGQGLH